METLSMFLDQIMDKNPFFSTHHFCDATQPSKMFLCKIIFNLIIETDKFVVGLAI